MRLWVVLVLAVVLPDTGLAGAGEGQFMGYRLGDSYQRSGQTRERITTSGNLAIEAENPIKPADIGDVTLVVTPETLQIGYINALTWFGSEADAREFGRKYVELLRAKYPDWAFGREVMDANVRVVEVNLDKHPYNLQIRLTKGPRDGRTMWRISMTLRWLPETEEAKAWRSLSYAEQTAARDKNRQLLLDQTDTRGL